ncbi:hypothetical protein ABIB40_002690 [Pedobacter sp. UYP30]|uniref:hypothetical protein n=1 Tax=Pedobacter sp. UYP30 TaxID=1756400 RepID=UPI003391E807
MSFKFFACFILFLIATVNLYAQNSKQIAISNSDLTATDALGRTLPGYKETGPPKPDLYVGLFYWLWHDNLRSSATNPDSINVTEILANNPGKTDWRMEDYYWNEPENGYYLSADPWVMKKHLRLFATAGIDFIFLDFTNGSIYETELEELLNTIHKLRQEGTRAPYVVPFLNSEYGWKVKALYEKFYKSGKYDDIWFRWQGKPLLMSPLLDAQQIKDSGERNEIENYFTWRPTWALFDGQKAGGQWRFMDTHPQRAALDSVGKIEQFVVSKSLGAPLWDYQGKCSSCGINYTPKFDKYWLAKETGTGTYFREQWNRADSVKAPILLVTGWNEWKAGAWPTSKELAAEKDFKFQGRKMHEGDMYFVDEFNDEFNRDIEPMKNGYTDNFYYQFVSRMRKYKGMLPPQTVSKKKTIKVDGNFSQWENVTPIYKDFVGDTEHRDFDGARAGLHYTNNTGRNDIIESRVARDNTSLYFYVKTAAPISSYKDKNWMMLFIDADNNKKTGWEGYDYLINSEIKNKNTTTLKKWASGKWYTVTDMPFNFSKNEMEIKVSLNAIKLDKKNIEINFHWADNIQKLNDINEFFTNGDSAPERRFDYHYNTN